MKPAAFSTRTICVTGLLERVEDPPRNLPSSTSTQSRKVGDEQANRLKGSDATMLVFTADGPLASHNHFIVGPNAPTKSYLDLATSSFLH
jgi:hypothetical protein